MRDYVDIKLKEFDDAIDMAIKAISQVKAEAEVLIQMLENLKSKNLDKRNEG